MKIDREEAKLNFGNHSKKIIKDENGKKVEISLNDNRSEENLNIKCMVDTEMFKFKEVQIVNNSNHHANNNFKQNCDIFSLPNSPKKQNNNFLISPIIENKTVAGMMTTPHRAMLSDICHLGVITPQINFDFKDLKINSPFQENMVRGLKYDEKSSSFKRIRINNIHNEIFGRNINFENGPLGFGNDKNDNGCLRKNFTNIRTSLSNKKIINKNSLGFQIHFSSDNDSSSKSDSLNGFQQQYRQHQYRHHQRFVEKSSKMPYMQGVNRINIDHKKINIDSDKESNISGSKKILCCTCTKSRCLKKYCECFANNEFCFGCECLNCYNLPQYRIKSSINYSSVSNTGEITKKDDCESNLESQKVDLICNCTKSNCMKKYCECFKAGQGCKELCRCINCENNKEIKVVKKEVLTEAEKEKRKVSRNPINFIIEGISVYIQNENISVTQRKEIPDRKDYNENIKNNQNNFNNTFTDFGNDIKSHIDLNEPDNKIIKNYSKIFQVNSYMSNNSSNETPKIINKKRKRIHKDDDPYSNSYIKTNSTLIQTPLFTISNSEKSGNLKKKIKLDKKIIKNLDKMY